MPPALRLLAVLAPSLLGANANGVEAAARLGIASPQGGLAQLGPTFGLSLAAPLRGRVRLTSAVDLSMNGLWDRPAASVAAVTSAVGLEAMLDLLPVTPTFGMGPAYQFAWRSDGASSHTFGGFLSLGLRAVVDDHLVVAARARYLTAAFGADTFPAFSTFTLEFGWTG